MTLYIFENMTGEQAANFDGAADQIVFANPETTALNVSVGNSGGLDLVTLTAGGVSRTFGASQLKAASLAGRVAFADGSDGTLVIGTTGADTGGAALTGAGIGTAKGVYYGLNGDDTITTNNSHSYVYGGNGGDTITGGTGADHLYGFSISGNASDDGDDSIDGGAGNDYIQGNAGEDTLIGGLGNDRINGGADDDTITGNEGADVINGNKGDDDIEGNDGNDVLRGGQGKDTIDGGADNDTIFGDLGDDEITGGTGYDVMTGGAGADTFVFAEDHATLLLTGANAYRADAITDFAVGEDLLDLGGTLGQDAADIIKAQAGISLSSVGAAVNYAQQLLTNAVNASAGAADTAIVALQIGADTYLFYDDDGVDGVINSAIKLDGVTAADFTFESIV